MSELLRHVKLLFEQGRIVGDIAGEGVRREFAFRRWTLLSHRSAPGTTRLLHTSVTTDVANGSSLHAAVRQAGLRSIDVTRAPKGRVFTRVGRSHEWYAVNVLAVKAIPLSAMPLCGV